MLEFHDWMCSMGFELLRFESVDIYRYEGIESVIMVRGRSNSTRVEVDSYPLTNPFANHTYRIDCRDMQVGLEQVIRCILLIFIETR